MDTLKALILTIIVLYLVSEGQSYLQDSLRHKQFTVPFIDSRSRSEVFLNILQN